MSWIKQIKSIIYLVFNDEELTDVVSNPYEWGHFDQQMAKKILKEKGVIITDDFVKQAKKKKVSELSVIKPVSKIKIIAGYALAVIVPVFGILIALSIIYNRNVLPNGEKFYVHSAADKREGELILIIGISSLCMMVVGYFVYH